MSRGGHRVADRACQEMEEHHQHHHIVSKAGEKKRLLGLRRIITDWSPNHHRIPFLPPRPRSPTSSLADYGVCKGIVHCGPTSTIQLYEKSPGSEDIVAIKIFHRHPSQKSLSKCPFSDNSILLSLNHPNIINVLSLLRDKAGNLGLVMEYCGGGSLTTIATISPEPAALDCVFKKMVRGVHYLHWNGIGHRYLRPGTILFTLAGTVKISNFDQALYCPNTQLKSPSHGQGNVPDSDSYIAPEVYSDGDYDVPPIDVWALGMLYVFLRTGGTLWEIAREEDGTFSKYLDERIQKDGFVPIEALGPEPLRNVIYAMLDPLPSRRTALGEALRSEWLCEVKVCEAGERA